MCAGSFPVAWEEVTVPCTSPHGTCLKGTRGNCNCAVSLGITRMPPHSYLVFVEGPVHGASLLGLGVMTELPWGLFSSGARGRTHLWAELPWSELI